MVNKIFFLGIIIICGFWSIAKKRLGDSDKKNFLTRVKEVLLSKKQVISFLGR